MKKSRKIAVGLIAAVFLVIAILGITYAYFVANVRGNTNEVSVSTKAGKLSLVYEKNGDDTIVGENILPGFTQTKSFTVTNNGTGTVSYGVFLEDVVNTFERYTDLNLTITCTSSTKPSCNGYDGTMLRTNDLVLTNEIDSTEVQTYNVTFTYINANESQNKDNQKRVYGKFQIYDLEPTVDLEGTVNNASDGDYVVVNSEPKRSEIVDGKFKVVGLEPGNHTINVYNENNTETPKSTSTMTIELGTTEGVSGTTVTMAPTSRIINSSIDASSNGVTISKVSDGKILLADTIIENARNVTNEEKALLYAEYSETPKTAPAEEVSGENESTLSKALDGENTYSYYFRGNVANNYVNFAGMCWKIIRITGNGSIKIILQDKNMNCNDMSYTGEWAIDSSVIFDADNTQYSGKTILNYLHPTYNISKSASTVLKQFQTSTLTTLITNKYNKNLNDYLESGNWCYDDIAFTKSDGTGTLINDKSTYYINKTTFMYDSYVRLYGLTTKNPIFNCNGNVIMTFDDDTISPTPMYVGSITADEAVYAGGMSHQRNTSYYLSNSGTLKIFWTMSPSYFVKGFDYMYYITNSGTINSYNYITNVNDNFSIRPVIVLKSGTEIIAGGVGTQSNPYVVK